MKKIMLSFLVLIFISLFLSSCNSKLAPGCWDEKTKDTVYRIAKQQAEKKYGKEKASELKFELDYIVFTDINKDTGKCSCEAELSVTNIKTKAEDTLNITYTSEIMEKKAYNSGFLVKVSGLHKL